MNGQIIPDGKGAAPAVGYANDVSVKNQYSDDSAACRQTGGFVYNINILSLLVTESGEWYNICRRIGMIGGVVVLSQQEILAVFEKWVSLLRLEKGWDVILELVCDPAFTKTGDIRIDTDDRKAILLLNALNPKQENMEEVICHELLHLKLYPLDQLTEGLIDGHYERESPEYNTIYTQFMTMLEQTVEELTKCYLGAFGENKALSYGRCRTMKSFNDLYDGLKPLN